MVNCSSCQKEVTGKFCTGCGAAAPAAAAAAPLASSSSSSSSSASVVAPVPAAAPLPVNNNKIAMDEHEFKDFLASLTRGLMQFKDQLTKIKAAASAHFFTCAQVIQVINITKGQPVDVIITLFPAVVDVDQNFASVLLSLKWIEERQEVVQKLQLDAGKYAAQLKK